MIYDGELPFSLKDVVCRTSDLLKMIWVGVSVRVGVSMRVEVGVMAGLLTVVVMVGLINSVAVPGVIPGAEALVAVGWGDGIFL